MVARVAALGMLGLALAAAPGARGADGDGGAAELEELRRAIEESRERVGGHERQERQFLERLEELDRALERLTRGVATTRAEARRARATLAETEERAKRVDSRLRRTRTAMRARAIALYKAGEVGPLRVLFSSTSLPELFSRVTTLQTLVAHDAELVARFRRDLAELESAREQAEQATRQRDESAARLRARRGELAAERSARRELLARVREDRAQERGLLVELERASRVLEDTLSTLGDTRRQGDSLDGSGFERLRGELPAPVRAEIARGFGTQVDEEFLTRTFSNGIQFAASAGDSVRAVASGAVRFAGWFRGYGKIAILDHGDGYFTVSGHLDEVFVDVGEPVDAGDTIGTVGETGSLSGPALYFELRRGGEPLDPSTWLRAASSGRQRALR